MGGGGTVGGEDWTGELERGGGVVSFMLYDVMLY